MGKKIDGFILTCVLALACYLYFFFAFRNQLAALLLSSLTCMLLLSLFRRIRNFIASSAFIRKRKIRMQAGSLVMKIACMPGDESRDFVSSLISQCYEGNHCLEVIQMHPSMQLSAQRIFEIWKEYQGVDGVVVCATCPADENCRALASAMKSPRIALIDASGLEQMIYEHPESMESCESAVVRRKLHLRFIAQLFINRKNAPKNLLLAGSMLLMYLFTANIFYLFSALLLAFAALASLHKGKRPAKLF